MSMEMLTVLQIAGIFAAYLGVTMVAPWLLLKKRFAGWRQSVKLMAYFMCGNFYVINLVYLLQILHISYRPTLIIGTLLPFGIAAAAKYKASFSGSLLHGTRHVRRIVEGEMGIKTQIHRIGQKLQKLTSGLLGEWMAPCWPDAVLTLGIVVLIFYAYGTNAISVYGYCESDVVVHNYWINEMGNNNIFVAGVYPFGFHNVIYYLHEVFNIPTFVLLRTFWFVQTMMVHLMLLFFLKAVCKSKYAAYGGAYIYVAVAFYKYAYIRYYASMPQEFGMIFILPSLYFAIAFFLEKGSDPGIGEGKGKRFDQNLILFAISVSMTLAVHFYNAIVTALFCIGLAIGFIYKCFRWRYLKRIVLAGIVGILLAVFPLAAAFAMGTPLQSSLYWGMDVMSGEKAEGIEESEEEEVSVKKEAPAEKGFGQKQVLGVIGKIDYYITRYDGYTAWFLLGSTVALFLLGVMWIILKRRGYGSILISLSVCILLLFVLQDYSDFGLPQLIAEYRCCIYIVYGMAMIWALGLDSILFLLFKERRAIHKASLIALAVLVVLVAVNGIREPMISSGRETNEAVTCLTNIIRENREGDTWTICSANDERQMGRDYGNHYELIDFLMEMEHIGNDTSIMIPTKTVYFFVEKVPILADKTDEGRAISSEGAKMALPKKTDVYLYEEDSRWIVMSHLYYWAQAFQRLYPNEMEVYYETDQFVCYRVQQNEYSLYNFAIDYGYN